MASRGQLTPYIDFSREGKFINVIVILRWRRSFSCGGRCSSCRGSFRRGRPRSCCRCCFFCCRCCSFCGSCCRTSSRRCCCSCRTSSRRFCCCRCRSLGCDRISLRISYLLILHHLGEVMKSLHNSWQVFITLRQCSQIIFQGGWVWLRHLPSHRNGASTL